MNTISRAPWRVLLIDDDEDEYILSRGMLASSRDDRYLLDWQPNCGGGIAAILSSHYDAILVDYSLGMDNGIDFIVQARQHGCTTPIIMITGMGDSNIDREAMQAGANDYLDRSVLTPALLERTIRYNIRNHHAAQEAQSQIEAERVTLNTVIEKAPAGIFMTDADGNFTVVNPEASKIFPQTGVTGDARGPGFGYVLLHMDGSPFLSEDLPLVRSLKGEVVENLEMLVRHNDGTDVYVMVNSAPIFQGGKVSGTVAVMRNVTDYLKARQDLRESEERELARASQIEAIMNAVPAAVWMAKDPEGKTIDANDYGYRIIRMQPGQNPSKSAGEGVAPAHFIIVKDGRELAPEEMPVQVAARGIPVTNYEYDIVFDDGETVHMLGNATPVWKNGSPVGSVSAFINITERKQTEQALRESEERLRTALRSIRGFVWEHDLYRGAIYRSDGFDDVTGFRPDEIGNQDSDWISRIHPDDIPQGVTAGAWLHGPAQTYVHEHRFRHKNGQWVWLQEQGHVLLDASGTPVRIVGATIDVTSRKNVELALRDSEERFHNVLDNTSTVMFTMDKDLRYTWIYNPNKEFGSESVIGKTDYDLLAPEDAEIVTAPKREVLQTGKSIRCELVYRINGNPVAYQAAFEPIFSDEGSISGLRAVTMETTDTVKLRQQQIKDQAHIEIQRRIIEQREQERLQIARDLHDGPLQTFTAISFALQGLASDTKDMPELQSTLREMITDLHAGTAELRSYASELRPPALSSFGLEKAIAAHLRDFKTRHTDLRIFFEAKQIGTILPEAPRMAMYRIYQELMNNIVKHAQASEVRISFQKTLEQAELIVQDNGEGFTVPEDWLELARNKHLGLVGLQERAEAVGGTVEITSAPGEGTTVRVQVPLEEA